MDDMWRDYKICTIYGIYQWKSLVLLLMHAVFYSFISTLSVAYFTPICSTFETLFSVQTARIITHFTGFATVLAASYFSFAASNFFYSSVSLYWDMAQRMVNVVGGWLTVKRVLGVGCGSGILLNAVATKLKKEGSTGHVVGHDGKETIMRTLRRTVIEEVTDYATCKEGNARSLPFVGDFFDVVVSAMYLHSLGKKYGHQAAKAAAERIRGLEEVVRVLKPGGVGVGVGVVWDLVHVPEYVKRLEELHMEDIRASECVLAFMRSSHMVSFRKPSQHVLGMREEFRVDLTADAAITVHKYKTI